MRKERKKKEIKYPVTTQGKKGQPITVKNILHGSSISLKITATYEDWDKFLQLIADRKDHFSWDFIGSFVSPALENSKERLSQPEIGIYGTKIDYYKNKNNQQFVDDIKIQAALLYKHRQSEIPKKRGEALIDGIAQDLQLIFGNLIAGYKLKPFMSKEGPKQENFYLKYIYPGLEKLKATPPECLDRVHNLLLLLNYLELNGYVEKDNKKLFEQMHLLVFDFLDLHDVLRSVQD